MRILEQGTGQVQQGDIIRLLRPTATSDIYSNAQIDDYSAGMPHHAPLRLSLTANFSHPIHALKGTAGFGFWNAPFEIGTKRFRFPKTAWFFFGSPPLNIPLAMDVAGNGFKVATLDATHWQFFSLLPTAPIGFLLMRIRPVYRRLWRIGQYAIRCSEKSLELDITTPHRYQLDWLPDRVIFSIDGQVVHISQYSPTGNMGFVAWIDNQYAIVTPQGNFGWGVLAEPEAQWIDIQDLNIEAL